MDLKRMTKADLIGLIERADAEPLTVAQAVAGALPNLDELAPFDRARAAVALNLAGQLDAMAAVSTEFVKNPPAPAPVAKELAAVLAVLEAELFEDEDGDFFSDLSASMGDSAD